MSAYYAAVLIGHITGFVCLFVCLSVLYRLLSQKRKGSL